jgi:hypothetical protein
MMPSGKLKLEKSRKANIGLNVVDRISTLTMRMEHQERRDGPRNKCDRGKSGRRMVLINLVCHPTYRVGYVLTRRWRRECVYEALRKGS